MIDDYIECNNKCSNCKFSSWNPDIGTLKFPWYCSKYNMVYRNNSSIDIYKNIFKELLNNKN